MEVEIKIPLDKIFLHKDAVNYLSEKLGTPDAKLLQSDTYYQSPVRDFWISDEALRIREIKYESGVTKVEFTYKGAKKGNSLKIREELSVALKTPLEMKMILDHLGFEEVAVIEKQRTNWVINQTTISLDYVKGLGTYIEVEILIPKEKRKIKEGKEKIIQLVKEIIPNWNGEEERRSYLELSILKSSNS